jgi:tetratricopeptide (TPR) repeat protein
MRESHLPQSHLEDQLDRHARGELTAAEARDLAQKSLDDPELFDDLTYSALAKKAISEHRFPRKTRFVAMIAAAAAVLVLVSLYSMRSLLNPAPRSPSIRAVSEPTYNLGQPILLGTNFGHVPPAPVFRGVESGSRLPREKGSVVAIGDGVASIDLGSVDGLEKGTELGIYRDSQATTPIAQLIIETVFRERARGRIVATSPIPIHSEVRVPSASHLNVLLEHVDALCALHDLNAAKTMAEKVVAWTDSTAVPLEGRARALEKLAAIEYQTNSLASAEQHYLAIAKSGTVVYAESRNNLGALAEQRGDRDAARKFYAEALQTLDRIPDAPPAERQAIESNLARFKGGK